MGINALQFNNFYNANLQPGMVLESGARSTSGIYSFTTAMFASATSAQANFFQAGNFTFSVTQTVTGRTLFSNINQGAAIDVLSLISQLAQAFNPLYNVSLSAGIITIAAKTPGAAGAFTVTIVSGNVASSAPTDPLPLLPGRIVVNDNTLYTGTVSSYNPSVVYPTTTNATTQTLGGLYVTGFGDIVNVAPTPFDNTADGQRVPVGNIVELYTNAPAIVMQSVTALSTSSALFVETSTANSGRDTGKLTGTATATTVALPNSRLQVVQGTATAGGLVIVQLT